MKNKLIILIYFFVFFYGNVIANDFKFETKSLEIFKDSNKIIAIDGIASSLDGKKLIIADKFEYFKDTNKLYSSGNVKVRLKNKNLFIEFDNGLFDNNKSIITANGNVVIKKLKKSFVIKTENIFFNEKKNFITSSTKTILEDNLSNKYYVDKFKYEIDKDIVKLTNLLFIDKDGNNLQTNLAFINIKSGKLFGKDLSLYFKKNLSISKNDPRLKAKSFKSNKDITEFKKGVFTMCKVREDNCPPWEVRAKKIEHNKKSKTIIYEKALLKIYDIPIMYFPKFFHPDPTVKRQSGFLIPGLKNSNNSGNYLDLPYYLAISQNKDATLNPRIYNDKFLLQTEYRQKNKNSNHIADFSFFNSNKSSDKNHFFYDFSKIFKFKKFKNSDFNYKIQHVSDDTYLKKEKIKSKIVNNQDILENSAKLNFFSESTSLNVEAYVYENLDKSQNDRYEYILPKINLTQNLYNRTPLEGNFTLKSDNIIRNYNTNIYQRSNINDLNFKSFPKISKNGFYNNYEFLLKNTNIDNKNSSYKNNFNSYTSGIFQFNSSLPLFKENENYQKILRPKFSFKIAPNHTKDSKDENEKITNNNIFSIDRLSEETVEGGLSLAYGGEYSVLNKKKFNEVLNFKISNNLRLKENDDLPNDHQLDEKTSNIFNEIIFTPNKYFSTSYINSIKNNLNDISYENFISEFSVNNFITKFDYLNENNNADKNSYLSNDSSIFFDDNNSFNFSTRKNKTKNLTEYYKFMYQYKNDCLVTSLEYNKDFYNDRDIKPTESFLLKLTIIPFGETSSPDLLN